MSSRERITAVAAAIERTPPEEIQLWNAGSNPTDYGDHVWNERSVKEVVAEYAKRGNRILLDVEHAGSKKEDGSPTVTAGYATLEVRNGAPWLRFEWSEYGAEQIKTGQRRYLSPEYSIDKATGEIVALYRVSLVAEPGTHNARVLARAGQSTGDASMSEQKKVKAGMDIAVVLAALTAAMAAEDPAVVKESISNLVSELKKAAGGETAPAEAPEAPKPVDAEAAPEPPKEDEKKDEKEEPVMATKVPETVETVSAAAVKQLKDAQRDHLLTTKGEHIDPSLQRWAASQPLEVVKSFLDACPAKAAPTPRVKATLGAAPEFDGVLTERELQKCKAKGVDPAKYAAFKQANFGAALSRNGGV